MFTLFVNGHPVGSFPFDPANGQNHLEARDENGQMYRLVAATPMEPLVPWDPTITREDIERVAAEPGMPYEEVKKRLGWE